MGSREIDNIPLNDLLARLANCDQVEGLLQIGSLAQQSFNPASDYDLVIVLRPGRAELGAAEPAEVWSEPWFVGVTEVDGRFTDLLFVTTDALEQVLALTQAVEPDAPLAPIIRWLQQGQLCYDRAGRLRQAQEKVRLGEWIEPINQDSAYGAWFSINYNLAQTRRMLQSPDEIYRQTVEIRMAVYGHMDIWFGYFTMRKLAWDGDKWAVRYLNEHDPAFLTSYRQFVRENDRERKFAHYEQAAAMATLPLGGLWSRPATVSNLQSANQLWATLIAEEK